MNFISHRGCISGPNPEKENHPDFIDDASNAGFDVEIDVWHVNGAWFLGHDAPQYSISEKFLLNERFWHHAKNINAFYHLNKMRPNYLINCFFHNTDDCTLTSGGWLWTYPGKELTDHSIAVMPEMVSNWDISTAYGICTDYPIEYKKDIKFKL